MTQLLQNSPPAHEAEIICWRCLMDIPRETFPENSLDDAAMGVPVSLLRLSSGALLTPKGATYCARCGPSVKLCRVCGCSDECGCEDGCWWEEADLCSQCAGEPNLTDLAREIFNPDGHVHVTLPCGAVVRVAPDVGPETLAALDAVFVAASHQVTQTKRSNP